MGPRRIARAAARRLRAITTIPREDRLPFARAWWMLLSCRLRLRFPGLLGGHRLVQAELARQPTLSALAPDPAAEARLVAIFNLAAANHLVHFSCLPRALALKAFLDRHGIPSLLKLGVRKDGSLLDAHAWLEQSGSILNDREAHVRLYHALDCELVPQSIES